MGEELPIVSIYKSINGEVATFGASRKYSAWGALSTFIRIAGCPVNCTWCDERKFSWDDKHSIRMTIDGIVKEVKKHNTESIVITGGEPMMHEDELPLLVNKLIEKIPTAHINIYTSGVYEIYDFLTKIVEGDYLSLIMDYKLKSAKANLKTLDENIKYLEDDDYIKFVVTNIDDLEEADFIIKNKIWGINNLVQTVISPCMPANKAFMEVVVEFMKYNNLTRTIFQPQLHKFIWGNKKDV